jgi:hypothetical protein
MEGQLNILLRAYPSVAEFSDDCDYALVRLNANDVERLRKRMATARRLQKVDSSLCCLEYWDGAARYFARQDGLDEIIEREGVDDGEVAFVTDDVVAQIPESAYRMTEEERVVVFPDSVYWECRAKHRDEVNIETARVGKQQFTRTRRGVEGVGS